MEGFPKGTVVRDRYPFADGSQNAVISSTCMSSTR